MKRTSYGVALEDAIDLFLTEIEDYRGRLRDIGDITMSEVEDIVRAAGELHTVYVGGLEDTFEEGDDE